MVPMILGAIALFALCTAVFAGIFSMPIQFALIGACMTVGVAGIFMALVA